VAVEGGGVGASSSKIAHTVLLVASSTGKLVSGGGDSRWGATIRSVLVRVVEGEAVASSSSRDVGSSSRMPRQLSES